MEWVIIEKKEINLNITYNNKIKNIKEEEEEADVEKEIIEI